MPFDGPEPDAPTLANLAAILRDRTRWPEGFVWNYGNCATCALGLAWELGHHRGFDARDVYGMSDRDFSEIFLDPIVDPDDVTPEDVALAIDAYLARIQA